MQRVAHQRGGFADRDHAAATLRQWRTQFPQIASLELAAHQRDDTTLETLNRSPRRFHVGRLRIVDEPHVTNPTSGLHHVLETMKPTQGVGHGVRRHSCHRRNGSGCNHVVQHVATGQFDRRHRNEAFHRRVCPPHNPVIVQEKAIHDRAGGGEHHSPRSDATAARHDRRVIGVDDCPIGRLLVRKDARFRRRVRLDGWMPIEMVGGEVEPQRDPWTEPDGRLELKAAHLDDVHRLRRGAFDLHAQRHPDVSADQDVASRLLEHPAEQRCRRRFSFRAGDRHDRTLHPTRGELELADDLCTVLSRRFEHRLLGRHSRTDHHQVGLLEGRGRVAARFEGHAGITQPCRIIDARAALGQHHARASSRQQFCCGDSAASRTDDHHTSPDHREGVSTHVITAASALSD